MKNGKYRILKLISLSFTVIGFIFCINVLEAYLLDYDNLPMVTSEFLAGKTIPEAYLKRNLAMAGVTIASGLASQIYQKEEWSLLKRTIVSFSISIFSFILMLYYLKILSSKNLYSIIGSIITFVAIYIIIWLISYKKTKNDIEKINQELKKTGN